MNAKLDKVLDKSKQVNFEFIARFKQFIKKGFNCVLVKISALGDLSTLELLEFAHTHILQQYTQHTFICVC